MKKGNAIFKKLKNSPIIIHPLFILFGIYCYFFGRLSVFVCYTLSALIHELGHFMVARRLGYKLLQIKLMPYGAELSGNLDEFLYKDEIKIALAGPITSVLLSGFLVMAWWIFPNFYNYTIEMCVSSIVCGVFNMLPVFPLDGGRVLVSWLCTKFTREKAVAYAKTSTRVLAVILFFMFVISFWYGLNLSFIFVSIMLFNASFNNSNKSCYFLVTNLKGKLIDKNKLIDVQEVVVGESSPIYSVVRKLSLQKYYKFIVVNKDMKVLFKFSEDKLSKLSIDEYKMQISSLYSKLK